MAILKANGKILKANGKILVIGKPVIQKLTYFSYVRPQVFSFTDGSESNNISSYNGTSSQTYPQIGTMQSGIFLPRYSSDTMFTYVVNDLCSVDYFIKIGGYYADWVGFFDLADGASDGASMLHGGDHNKIFVGFGWYSAGDITLYNGWYLSGSFILNNNVGSAAHIAYVFDKPNKTLYCYVNGDIAYKRINFNFSVNRKFRYGCGNTTLVNIYLAQLCIRNGDFSTNNHMNFPVPSSPYHSIT